MALSFNRKKENTLIIDNQHVRDDLWQRVGEKGKAPSLEKMLGTALMRERTRFLGTPKNVLSREKRLERK